MYQFLAILRNYKMNNLTIYVEHKNKYLSERESI